MKKNIEKVHFMQRDGSSTSGRTGVSLHCHTMHSREILDFVPYYAERIPVASFFYRRFAAKSERRYDSAPDFSKGFWTPPLAAREVYLNEIESMQSWGLGGLVSVTDHDSIVANLELEGAPDTKAAPISMEWTVPYDRGFFHVGVHNLPSEHVEQITSQLFAYTKAEGQPDNNRLHELFAFLNEYSGILLVLNHPVWDIEMIGQPAHEGLLARFLIDHASWIHAIEINGFRSWAENLQAAELADSLGLPIISGGDRHCFQRNTIVNVTDAASFEEFASEVRFDRQSSISVLPEYHEALPCRQLRSIVQILGTHKHLPEGRRRWTDRVYFDMDDGKGLRPLSKHWDGRSPIWTYPAFLALSVLTLPFVQPIINLIVGDNDIGRSESNRILPAPASKGRPVSV